MGNRRSRGHRGDDATCGYGREREAQKAVVKRGKPQYCLCGCEKRLTGKQRFWASDACRSWYNRNRESTGNDRESTGFQTASSGFFLNRQRAHDGDIRRGIIDPDAPGHLEKSFKVEITVHFCEKYDTKRQQTELYALINHKMLRDHIKKLLQDYNPGWTVTVEISKKSMTE